MNSRTQVLIIGGGPTGLMLAAQLHRYNVDFIIVEKNEATTELSKALVVQARSLEIFREIGLADKAIATGQVTTALNVFYKGKRRAFVNLSGLGEGISAFPFALSLEQSKTEKLLVDYLKEKGKTINWNTTVTRFEQNDRTVTAYCRNADGEEQKIEADYLVGCDGAASAVRHQLGLSFEGSTEPKLFYVADVILKSSVVNTNELFVYMISKGFILFFPMEGDGHYRIVGVLPDANDFDKEFSFDDISPSIKENLVSPIEFVKLRWFSTYRVHSRKADSFMKGRCFIAGDAAHIHTPAGGQGMNTGIQDAYNLAWKIACSLQGEVNQETLETYNTERTENARNLLRSTDRMFDIFSGINPFWNFLRLNFFPALLGLVTKSKFVAKRIFPLISQTGIAYPDSFLTLKSEVGKVKAGDRMHYFVFPDGKDIFGYLTPTTFKLLFFGDEKNNASTRLADAKIRIAFIHFNDIPKSLFGGATDFYVLLRPDNHISYIGQEIEKCIQLLDKIAQK
jgi:2-polyprenyl-6-methoxyphenol hydroxylase-like FAD-dependent oxidoreductase